MQNTDQALANLITKATNGIDGAVEFSREQLPEVVNQLLLWKTVEFSLGIVAAALVVLASAVVIFYTYKAYKDEDSWACDDCFETISISAGLVFMVSAILFLVAILRGFNCAYNLIEICVAPKIYLLEYASGLVR